MQKDQQAASEFAQDSFSQQDWERLRGIWSAIKSSQQLITRYKDQLSAFITQDSGYRDYASDVQNRQIRLRVLRQRLGDLRERVGNARTTLTQADRKRACIGSTVKTLDDEIELMDEDIRKKKDGSEEFARQRLRLFNELVFRRRFMIHELYRIYFVDDKLVRLFKRQCTCSKFDVIRGLHLPATKCRQGHKETELCAAIGHVVNLVEVLSRVLAYPLRNPVIFKGSKSLLFDRQSGTIFHLHTGTKAQRERFDQALSLLNENIVQLRADLGLTTRDKDRPIQNLQEAMLCCIGRYRTQQDYVRPKKSALSPSSAIPFVSPTAEIDVNPIVEKMCRTLTMDEDSSRPPPQCQSTSILDVISGRHSHAVAHSGD